jgi:hypothetical protein
MSRPALPEERGADLQQEPLTRDEIEKCHDWRQREVAEGRYVEDVCAQCGRSQSAGARGPFPDCPEREVPERFEAEARRRGML